MSKGYLFDHNYIYKTFFFKINMNILVPMAGRGSRFLKESDKNPAYAVAKPIIKVDGEIMVKWALSSLRIKKEDNLIFLVLKEHVDEFQIDKILKDNFGGNIKVITVDKVTEGSACTALLAKKHINNEEPLIITDSDHYFDGKCIFNFIDSYKSKLDGVIPVFYANNSKWSFSRVNSEGFVIETAEKFQISKNAHVGAYYFSKGMDFVWAAEEMIEEQDKTNEEFFIAPVYNYLIRRGRRIRLIRPKFVHGLGTPEDLDKFLIFLRRGEIEKNFDEMNSIKEPKKNDLSGEFN